VKHQPLEAGEDADDILRVTLAQVRHRRTIPPTAPDDFCWFPLRRGRETNTNVTPIKKGGALMTLAARTSLLSYMSSRSLHNVAVDRTGNRRRYLSDHDRRPRDHSAFAAGLFLGLLLLGNEVSAREGPPHARPARALGVASPRAAVAATSAGSTPTDFSGGSASALLEAAVTPDLFMGGLATEVPLQIPPGRNGIEPLLRLRYRSLAIHNGWLGVGWNLDLGSIEARRQRISSLYFQDCIEGDPPGGCYNLSLDGAGRHIVRTSQDTFQLEAEGPFYRIERLPSEVPNDHAYYFRLTNKRGTVFSFGSTDSSRQTSQGGEIRRWALDTVTDTSGNSMTLTYFKDASAGALYPQSILYTSNLGVQPLWKIALTLESRPDVETTYIDRFRTSISYRLRTITVSSPLAGTLKTYVFSYALSPVTGGRSLLSSIQLTGADGVSTMPPLAFSYQQTGNAWASSLDLPNGPSAGAPIRDQCIIGDFDGDGRLDLACHAAGAIWTVALSRGGSFSTASWNGGPAVT